MNIVFLKCYIFYIVHQKLSRPSKKSKRPTRSLRQNLALYYETTIVVKKKISNISLLYDPLLPVRWCRKVENHWCSRQGCGVRRLRSDSDSENF